MTQMRKARRELSYERLQLLRTVNIALCVHVQNSTMKVASQVAPGTDKIFADGEEAF